MIDWFKHPKYLGAEKKKVSEATGAYALQEAWKKVYGEYPPTKALAVLWAKTCLETGRFNVGFWNYNFGNIKRKKTDDCYFTMFECGEEVTLAMANALKKEDPDLIEIKKTYILSNEKKMASITIKPGHLWSQFRAYKTIEDGAEDYIRFISQKQRYIKAWEKLQQGDPVGYSHELKLAGYYTANEERYTAGVVKLFDEFMNKKEELLSHDTEPSPPPSPLPEDSFNPIMPEIPPPPRPPTGVYTEDNKRVKRPFLPVIVVLVGIWAILSSFLPSCQ